MEPASWMITRRWPGISIGTLLSLAFGLVYLVLLREPGSAFYLFAGLTFLGSPLIGGVIAVLNSQERRISSFLTASGTVFGIVCGLFFLAYVILPQFERANVVLPPYCNGLDGSLNPPAHLTYTMPGKGTGILLTSDEETAVVAMVDFQQRPFPTTVWIVNKADNKILLAMPFRNDVVSAAIGNGIVYVYNDKIGFLMDAHTGQVEKNFLIIDNYGGLSQTDRPILPGASSDHWYMETTAVISSWNTNGTVVSRPHLTFNGIALGCFISGGTHEVIKY